MSNLELWDSVKTTDPDYTKYVSQRGGYTSISPQYQMQCATDKFGPYGKGWGFESIELDMSLLEQGLTLVKAVFFYVLEGERHTFPINNSWPINFGAKVDSDFAKKAETNTMSKALSKLGFSADIFMGEFDNPDYVEAIVNEFALEKAEDKIEEKAKQQDEYNEWAANSGDLLSKCQSMNELQKLFTGMVRKASLYKDQASIKKFTNIKDKRKAELEQE